MKVSESLPIVLVCAVVGRETRVSQSASHKKGGPITIGNGIRGVAEGELIFVLLIFVSRIGPRVSGHSQAVQEAESNVKKLQQAVWCAAKAEQLALGRVEDSRRF